MLLIVMIVNVKLYFEKAKQWHDFSAYLSRYFSLFMKIYIIYDNEEYKESFSFKNKYEATRELYKMF